MVTGLKVLTYNNEILKNEVKWEKNDDVKTDSETYLDRLFLLAVSNGVASIQSTISLVLHGYL